MEPNQIRVIVNTKDGSKRVASRINPRLKKLLVISVLIGILINLTIIFFQYPRVKRCQNNINECGVTLSAPNFGYGSPFYFKVYRTQYYEMFDGFEDINNDLLFFPKLVIDLAFWSLVSFVLIKIITDDK